MGFWSQDFTHNSSVSNLCRRKYKMNILTCQSLLLAANWSWSLSIPSKSISSGTMATGEQWTAKCGRLFTIGYKRKACSPLTNNLAFPSLVSVFHLTNFGRAMSAPPFLMTTSSLNKSLRTSVLSFPINMMMTQNNVLYEYDWAIILENSSSHLFFGENWTYITKGWRSFVWVFCRIQSMIGMRWPVVVDFGKQFYKL